MDEKILKQLEQIDAKIVILVNKLLKQNKPKELISAIIDKELDKYISELGIDKIAEQYANSLITSGLTTLTQVAKKQATDELINIIGMNLEPIAETYRDTILGYFKANTEKLKSELLNSLISGTPTSEITKSLQAKFTRVSSDTVHYLTDANINTVIQTSYSNVSRISTAKAFEEKPEQRFTYFGPRDEKNRDACAYMLDNQNPEGYTKSEIDAGIETPFGKINWLGPPNNWNCRHQWFAAD